MPKTTAMNIPPRQKQLARLLVLDFTQREASLIMNIQIGSIEQHQNRLYRAVGARSLADLKRVVAAHPEWFQLYDQTKGRPRGTPRCRRCGRGHRKGDKCHLEPSRV